MHFEQSNLKILAIILISLALHSIARTSDICFQDICSDANIITSVEVKNLMKTKKSFHKKLETSNPVSCNSSTLDHFESSVLLTKETNLSSIIERVPKSKHLWWLGICGGNVSVVLASNNFDCIKDKLSLLESVSNITHDNLQIPFRYEVFNFVSAVIGRFYETILSENHNSVTLDKYQVILKKFKKKCILIDFKNTEEDDHVYSTNVNTVSSVSSDSTDQISHETFSSVFTLSSSGLFSTSSNFIENITEHSLTSSSPNNKSETKPLTRHSHHGDIPYLIITLVCTLCGGSCLTFLLCFRRFRHLVCTCCNLCREANHYSRLFDDP